MRAYYLLPLLPVLLWACVDDGEQPPDPPDIGVDAGESDGGEFDAGDMPDAAVSDDGGPADDAGNPIPMPELVDVGHSRELRGVWVATVSNINFPSSQQLSAMQQQDELINLLDVLVDSHCNAIFFQVRPESDALYKSDLENLGADFSRECKESIPVTIRSKRWSRKRTRAALKCTLG